MYHKKITKSEHKRFLSFPAARKRHRRTNGQKAQTNMLPHLLRSWGHKNLVSNILIYLFSIMVEGMFQGGRDLGRGRGEGGGVKSGKIIGPPSN